MRYDATAQTSVFDDRVVAPTTRTPRRLYAVPNLSTSYRLVRLNRSGPFTMRAPGEAPGLFAVECAMDELAVALHMDPVALRLANHADEDPEDHQPWSSKHLRECYRQAAERFGWSRRPAEPRATRDGDWWVGTGMASMMYDARSSPARASATMDAAGHVTVRTATCDQGTGSRTILTQMAADAVGVPPGRVTVEVGDTDFPMASISAGSMTTASVGTAVTRAATDLRNKLVLTAVTDQRSPLAGRATDAVRPVGRPRRRRRRRLGRAGDAGAVGRRQAGGRHRRGGQDRRGRGREPVQLRGPLRRGAGERGHGRGAGQPVHGRRSPAGGSSTPRWPTASCSAAS